MDSGAILVTILSHPFQVLLAAVALAYAVGATVSGLSQDRKVRPPAVAIGTPIERHAA